MVEAVPTESPLNLNGEVVWYRCLYEIKNRQDILLHLKYQLTHLMLYKISVSKLLLQVLT